MQARTGSTRLPGKALKTICGKTVTELVIERIKTVPAGNFVCAIPEREKKSFSLLIEQAGMQVVRGSEEDVLSRFHLAASKMDMDIIIRITGDNPLVHPYFMEKAVEVLINNNCDYVNVVNAPIGCGVDVFTCKALRKAFSLEDLTDIEKEHIIPVFFREGLFQRASYEAEGKLSRGDLRLTMDTEQDFLLFEQIYENLYHPPKIVDLAEVIDFLDTHPDICSLNRSIEQKGWK